ncbi:hypothetical protein EC957_012243 [Mortierella hygrophila]|uniref:Uncharacterized protein n=1 Tax=Mortierella hygrophila TaxID=979708 RepID=A0A9P6F7S6_9FUNG|nr:hypothetical protein EC957_012243 [Mortierella hygrophila]
MINTQNKSTDSTADKDSSIKLSVTEGRESGLTRPRKVNKALIPNPAVVDTNLAHQHPQPLPKLQSERPQQGVQAIHLPSRNKTVHIATHFDSSSGNEIILWSDVLVVFRGALYLQHGTKVIPFLKGNDFRDLDPLRIACVPEITLDIVLEDAPTDSGTHSPSPQQKPLELPEESPQEVPQTPAVSRGRNPHGHMELAMANYSHMEAPRTDLRGPHICSNNNEDNSVSVSPSRQSVV